MPRADGQVLRGLQAAAIQEATRLVRRRGTERTEVLVAGHLVRKRQLDQVPAALALHLAAWKAATDEMVVKRPHRLESLLKLPATAAPTGRRDEYEAERLRWAAQLGALLSDTPTPAGEWLTRGPFEDTQLAAGRRAATLRTRVRMPKPYFRWILFTRRKIYPERVEDVIEYVSVRCDEPCTRGDSKTLKALLPFLECVSRARGRPHHRQADVHQLVHGVQDEACPTSAKRTSGALENFLCEEEQPIMERIHAWWRLSQSWAAMRHGDHRGLAPWSIEVSDAGAVGVLDSSKTTGDDKDVRTRRASVSAAVCGGITGSPWPLLVASRLCSTHAI